MLVSNLSSILVRLCLCTKMLSHDGHEQSEFNDDGSASFIVGTASLISMGLSIPD